jgi:DNA-binding Lrp family transcriptional regulator
LAREKNYFLGTGFFYSGSSKYAKISSGRKEEREWGSCLRIVKIKEGAMAIAAYIFIETMQGKAKTIARQIGDISGVKTAHTVTGPYDVITYVEADSLLTLGDFIVSKIQATPGVLRTLTNVIIDAP